MSCGGSNPAKGVGVWARAGEAKPRANARRSNTTREEEPVDTFIPSPLVME